MNKNSTYNYSDGDLLETPQKYQMTEFEGIKFLQDYFSSRKQFIKFFSNQSNNTFNLKSFIAKSQKKYPISKISEITSTNQLILFLLDNKISNNLDIQMKSKLDFLLKKFEIKKRIYESYDNHGKELSYKYDYLQNYLLLSILCLLEFCEISDLRYLNTALKINDTICSQKEKIISNDDKSLSNISLELEMEAIFKLLENKGIRL